MTCGACGEPITADQEWDDITPTGTVHRDPDDCPVLYANLRHQRFAGN